jgi:hypothetical protein
MIAAALLLLTRFVTPLEGMQAIGPQRIEITTDAQNIDRVEIAVDGALAGVARKAPWAIVHDFGTSMTQHTIKATVYSNGYRTSESAQIATAAMTAAETMNVDVVEVPLKARAGHLIRPAEIRVRENGVEQTVRDLVPQRGPAHFIFIVDRSLSMGDGKLTASLEAIDKEIHLLRDGDTASVVLFNHAVSRPHAIRADEMMAEVFGDIVPSGGTALYDAMASIVSRDRTYAIVITDGGDRNSDLAEEEALRRVSGTRMVVYGIVLGSRSPFLVNAAKNTGGDITGASRESVDDALRDTLADINGRYLLIYQSHGTKRGWRSVNVSARSRDVTVQKARKGYFAE